MRWDVGLNKKKIAVFRFGGSSSSSGGGSGQTAEDLRLSVGEELLLKLDPPTARLRGGEWQGQGTIVRIVDDGEVKQESKRTSEPNERKKHMNNKEREQAFPSFWLDRPCPPPPATTTTSIFHYHPHPP